MHDESPAINVPRELIDHLCRHSALTAPEAEHIAREVLTYFRETPESYVCRRHSELQALGWANARIYSVIRHEMTRTRFVSAGLTERQIRRLVYG